jgi:mono/diheme cytochrome c family protein
MGRAIYLNGVTTSGAPLMASRNSGLRMEGAAAACVNCHQRSGLGGREGRSAIPPITGRYLFRPRSKDGDDGDIPFVAGMRGDRDPYTDATLARAIREGLDSQGNPLSYLMPNYALSDADMKALISYLRQLDQRRVPGVTDTTLHFATIITPDADPLKRQGMLDVLKQFFIDRNARQMVPAPRMRTSSKTAYSKSMFMVHRRWELHVWELTGPASTWQRQLEQRLAREPVFAVVSGLGGKNWAPVHAFCEQAGLPCLFPNVELPVDREQDYYSLYFSKGVLLEAELIARELLDSGAASPAKKVRQVYREGDVGEAAAHALETLLKDRGLTVSNSVIAADASESALTEALAGSTEQERIVLWLRPSDVARLPAEPGLAPIVYLSGLMAGLESAPLPLAWRRRTYLAYPFDLPQARQVRVDFALGWFALRKIPVVSVQVQADTYLACGLLSETLNHMVDTFVRDFLIERVESQLEHRIVTGYYPRLALANGQHFASKGGHLVQFSETAGLRLVSAHNWIVP